MNNKPTAFWMFARRDGSCAECLNKIHQGERMVYDPVDYKSYCEECGEEIAGEDPRGNRSSQ